jgi:hypothetical protein
MEISILTLYPPPYPDLLGNTHHAGYKYLDGSTPLFGKEISDSEIKNRPTSKVVKEDCIDLEKRSPIIQTKKQSNFLESHFIRVSFTNTRIPIADL